jgi:hypothetical protein
LIIEPRWIWFVIGAWLLMLLARAAVSIRRNRVCYPASFMQNLARGAMVMSLIAVLDAAAIIGSIQWLLLDDRRAMHRTERGSAGSAETGNGA